MRLPRVSIKTGQIQKSRRDAGAAKRAWRIFAVVFPQPLESLTSKEVSYMVLQLARLKAAATKPDESSWMNSQFFGI
jgi:hypothetical protein